MEPKTPAIDAKKADSKTLGAESPKSQVNTSVSAEAMLDPADHSVVERSTSVEFGVKPGSSYPTPEAVQRELDAKQDLIDEKEHNVTRSALDHGQEAIVHPGAKLTDAKVQKEIAEKSK